MLVVINPAGPVHTVVTVTGTSTAGLNSTVQVKIGEDPDIIIMEPIGGVTVTVMGAGTEAQETTWTQNQFTESEFMTLLCKMMYQRTYD